MSMLTSVDDVDDVACYDADAMDDSAMVMAILLKRDGNGATV